MRVGFENALLDALNSVKHGRKTPEESVYQLYEAYPNLADIPHETRQARRDRKMAMVVKFKKQGLENATIAKRLGITTSYVRRLYKRAMELEARGDYIL
ncbi:MULTISPECIES: helix-turn-helix domain-containing protein [unclassified Maridesulfovibrio]|uniref:helix-turn-helix domain-containing protein n=1 Tax=unclassified Maridesulfovibrio TaxID=2794999 RepID=UPI002A188E0A|nr:helix-turn-helix domain-containing protein [Maridesulfovibrio sp.]